MRNLSDSTRSKRGAALILEIIIYLVIVSLIAVAVTTGIRAIKDLTFASHAKADIQNLQSWMESKYAQDGKYPGASMGVQMSPATYPDIPLTTNVGGSVNFQYASAVNGSQSGYCILIYSTTISNPDKIRFWLTSAEPHKIYQGGLRTEAPASGIPGVDCVI